MVKLRKGDAKRLKLPPTKKRVTEAELMKKVQKEIRDQIPQPVDLIPIQKEIKEGMSKLFAAVQTPHSDTPNVPPNGWRMEIHRASAAGPITHIDINPK